MENNIPLRNLNNVLDLEEAPPIYQEEAQETNNSTTENETNLQSLDIAFCCFLFVGIIGIIVSAWFAGANSCKTPDQV